MIQNDSWTRFSLFDAQGNVVQFNTLIGEETGFENEPINQGYTAGEYQSGERNLVMMGSPEFGGINQIRSWKAAKTELKTAAAGPARCYRWTQWNKPKQLTDSPKAQRSEGDSFIKAVIEDYDADPQRARNLLHGVSGTEIIFPIAGPTLTLAATGGAAFDLVLSAYDFSDTQLDTVTTSFNNERGSVELTLPSNTWKVTWNLNGATQASLRADGSTEYVAG